MTAIGKLFALLNLVAGLGLLTWSVNLYVHRPPWFAEPSESVDKGNSPVSFKQLQAETTTLYRGAGAASEAWGTNLQVLVEREKYRQARRDAYALRIKWAHEGNDKDLIDAKIGGKGFYEPVVNPATRLYDLTLTAAGLPKGKAVNGTDGKPLPGLDNLLNSIKKDTDESAKSLEDIAKQEAEFDRLDKLVIDTEVRALKLGVIRDSVQAEVFFLSTFEVNVFETRETVFRRQRQLRDRLNGLGVTNP